jgi:hypothetical protein
MDMHKRGEPFDYYREARWPSQYIVPAELPRDMSRHAHAAHVDTLSRETFLPRERLYPCRAFFR